MSTHDDMIALLVPKCKRCDKRMMWWLTYSNYFCRHCNERPCECYDNGCGYPGQVWHERGFVTDCKVCGGTGRLYGKAD